MISLIMAGGKGSRLGGVEKGLMKVCNKPIIQQIVDSLMKISDEIFVAVSRNTALTRSYLTSLYSVNIIETTGKDYVFDLLDSLTLIDEFPVIVAPSDMPFISERILRVLIDYSKDFPESVITVSIPELCNYYRRKGPTGLSLFLSLKGSWRNLELCLYPDLLDIDTLEDLREAREVCSRGFMEALG